MADLTGKVAIITGAGRGLGREEAMQLARQGARVVINDINRPEAAAAAHATVEDIKRFGGEAMAVLGDCADSGDAENLLKTTLQTYGESPHPLAVPGVPSFYMGQAGAVSPWYPSMRLFRQAAGEEDWSAVGAAMVAALRSR